MATWQEWKNDNNTVGTLHYVSVEKYPLSAEEINQALSQWPELQELKEDLLASYPLAVKGFHRLNFTEDNVTLTLIFDDVNAAFSECLVQVDAWYLDGFDPKKNPEMWRLELFHKMAEKSKKGTTLSTYTAVGEIKRQLQSLGFEMERVKGFGYKRHMLRGHYNGDQIVEEKEPWYTYPTATYEHQKAIVIGAGLAGAAISRSLAEKKWEVTVIEEKEVACGASGNAQGMFHPLPSLEEAPLSRFYLNAFLYSLPRFQQWLEPSDYKLCGVLFPAINKDLKEKQRQLIEKINWPTGMIQWLTSEKSSLLSGLAMDEEALFFPKGGWLSPSRLCDIQLQHPRITLQTNTRVKELRKHNSQWQVFDEQGKCISEASVLVIANANQALNFSQTQWLPLRSLRGQLSYVTTNKKTEELKTVLVGDSYILPQYNERHVVGATYSPHDSSSEVKKKDHLENYHQLPSSIKKRIDVETVENWGGRVSFRSASQDYLPLIGPVPDSETFKRDYGDLHHGKQFKKYPQGSYLQGLYVTVGHGSRGIISSQLAAELLISHINKAPLPLEKSVVNALNPARFLIRQLKRNKI